MVRRSVMVSLPFMLAILCLLLPIVSNGEDIANMKPITLVKRFCTLDAEGKRLSSATLTDIAALVTWQEKGGESMVVIGGFTVGKATFNNDTAAVSVNYVNIGSTDFMRFSNASRDWESFYSYYVVRSKGVWKINGPQSAPHMHWKAAIAYLRALEKKEPERILALETIIGNINNARKKLHIDEKE
jgi:hypothetical protein